MNLQMDPLDNPLTTSPIHTGCEISIELYPNWWFGCIDDPDCQFGNKSVPTRTRPRSTGPELSLTRIATEIHGVPGHSGIPGHAEADTQVNFSRDASGSTVIERPYCSSPNGARRISEGRSAAKAKWEADKCNENFSYRLKGKTGTKSPIPMRSVKLLAARFYRLKSGHVPTEVYLEQFGHRDDDNC